MVQRIIVNLPVRDMKRTMMFFTKLGFEFDSRFTDANAACLVVGQSMYVMLLLEKFFKGFSNKAIADTARSAEAIMALEVDSRDAVDALLSRVQDAGGTLVELVMDQGGMYSRSFEDPDGHLWEAFYMDPAALPASG
jgi:predicted lactoylglutathione lyase